MKVITELGENDEIEGSAWHRQANVGLINGDMRQSRAALPREPNGRWRNI